MTVSPLDVVAAIIGDGELVLACRRRAGLHSAGKWEFPGGKVEPSESEQDALRRELYEELRVRVGPLSHLCTDVTESGGRTIRLSCYRAALVGTRPESSTDHDALAWLTPSQLDQVDWAAPDLPAVRRLGDF